MAALQLQATKATRLVKKHLRTHLVHDSDVVTSLLGPSDLYHPFAVQLPALGLKDADMATLGLLKDAEIVNVNGNPVTDAGAVHLAALPKLANIYLEATQITDDGLMAFADTPCLRSIFVGGTQVTNDGVLRFRAVRPDVDVRCQLIKSPRTTQKKDRSIMGS